MLYPKPSNCVGCNIPELLSDIDCKLSDLGDDLYNNISFALNRSVPSEVFIDLLNYKRILTSKLCNSSYASCFSVEQIASRVKLLKYK
jgi:hypothetical protein